MRLRTLITACAGIVAALAVGVPAHAASEYAVKAAYLYKFAAFVEWPKSSFSQPDSPLNVCIVGFDPFGAYLDRAIAGQRIGERPVVARRRCGSAVSNLRSSSRFWPDTASSSSSVTCQPTRASAST